MQEFRLGPWQVDPLGRKVSHTQDAARPPVRISNKANRVLLALIQAEGRVVTREDLLDEVWPDVVVGDEVLTHAVAALRRAFGDQPKTPRYIETVHKAGYRLLTPVVAATEPSRREGDAAGIDRSAQVECAEASDAGLNTTVSSGGRPSIAVLPFVNLSSDPGQDYFSDGITEDIITELARFRTLAVAARNASFVYRGEAVDLRRVGRDLGVDYVLEGSARKLGERLRVTAQLVDARTGSHLWAERYDRGQAEIFEIQDEIAGTIVAGLSGEIASARLAQVRRQPHRDWHAYDHYLMARRYSQLARTAENAKQVLASAERATLADPDYALGYSMLANALRWLAVLDTCGNSAAVEAAYRRCRDTALKAVALNPSEPEALRSLGWSHMCFRNYAEAECRLRRSYELNPHDGDIAMSWVTALSYLGRPVEAIVLAQRTIERTPHHPDYYLFDFGEAHFFAGNYDQAAECFQKLPDEELDECRVVVIAAFALADSPAEAVLHGECYRHDLLTKWTGDPGASLAERIAWEFEHRHFHRRDQDTARLQAGLRRARLPVLEVDNLSAVAIHDGDQSRRLAYQAVRAQPQHTTAARLTSKGGAAGF